MHIIKNKLAEDYRLHSKNISLAKLYELLEIVPTPMQEGLIDLWDNKLENFSEVNIAASRRQGKTFSAAVLIVRELLIINSSTIAISKSAKSLNVLFNEVLRLLRVLGLKPSKINSNQYTLQLNDSILKCAVHRTMETLLGSRASFILLDECGTYAYSEDVNINLLPMRNDYSTYENTAMFVSKILRISSPREIGSDLFYDYIKGGVDKPSSIKDTEVYISSRGICSMRFSIYDSPLANPQLIESIKASNNEETFQTEYLAKFIHMNSISAFSMFNEDTNTFNIDDLVKRLGNQGLAKSFLELPGVSTAMSGHDGQSAPRLQGFMGLDVGFADKSAAVVCTVIDNNIYILDVFEEAHMTSKEFAGVIQAMIDKWSVGKLPLNFDEGAIYIDKTAALMNADLNNTYDIPSIPGYNKVREGISLMNTGFKTNKVFINKELVSLIDQISMLAFKETTIGSLNKSIGDPFVRVKGHHFDAVHAMRYMITSIMMYWGYATEASELDYEA